MPSSRSWFINIPELTSPEGLLHQEGGLELSKQPGQREQKLGIQAVLLLVLSRKKLLQRNGYE